MKIQKLFFAKAIACLCLCSAGLFTLGCKKQSNVQTEKERSGAGAQSGIFTNDGKGLGQAPFMMFQQRVDALPLNPGLSVSRKGETDGQIAESLQAVDIVAQRIHDSRPPGDIRGDVEQYVIAAEQDLFVPEIEHAVAGRMAGNKDGLQRVVSDLQDFAVLQSMKAAGGHVHFFCHGRI